jgi:hypothetical protein
MDAGNEPAKSPETEGEQSPAGEWRGDGPDGYRGGRDLIRSVLPILVGVVAVGIAAVAVVGVQISRRRNSKTLLYRAAVRAEDARNALTHRGRAARTRHKAAARRQRR